MATPGPAPDGRSKADAASAEGEPQPPLKPHPPASCPSSPVPLIPDHNLIRCIGRGAYGAVWLARNVMGTLRAVKLVHREDFSRDRPFTREYEGLLHYEPISRSHPNLMQILHVGRHDGYFYYVTELADDASVRDAPGRSRFDPRAQKTPDNAAEHIPAPAPPLQSPIPNPQSSIPDPDAYLPRTLQADLELRGRLPVRECVSLATALASALKHLHDRKLVHRDVKPSNVIFVHGVAKLADIGLVATAGDSRSIVGTEGYLPPEGPGTPPADLYALGMLLYELATGMKREDYPRLPVNLRDWPDAADLLEFNEVLLRACAKDADRRYHCADELLADLAVLERGASVKRLRRLERHHALIRRVGLGVLAIGLLVSAAWWQSWRAHRVVRQHLARLHVSEGTQRMVQGDYVAALPWLVGALVLDAGDPGLEAAHRVRIANVLRHCPFPVAWFNVPESRVLAADLSPDDTLLATAHEDGIVRVWDLPSHACIRLLPHDFPVMHCQFLSTGERILTGTLGQQVHIWNLTDPDAAPLKLAQAFGFFSDGYSVGLNEALGPSGRAYLSKGRYRFARTHPLLNRFENLTFSLKLIGQSDTLTVRYEIRPTAPGSPALYAGEFRDSPDPDPLDDGRDEPAFPLWGRAFAIFDNGSIGNRPGEGGRVIWDNVRVRRYPSHEPPGPWRVLDDSSDGTPTRWLHAMPPDSKSTMQVVQGQLVLASENLPTKSLGWPCIGWLELFEISPAHTLELEADLVSAQAPYRHVALSLYRPRFVPFANMDRPFLLQGRWLVLVRWTGIIQVWDLERNDYVAVQAGGREVPLELQLMDVDAEFDIHPDLKFLVVVGAGKHCTVRDLATGSEVAADKLAHWQATGVQFSPNHRVLALAHREGLELIRTGDWASERTLTQGKLCEQPQFSPNGSRLAVVCDGRQVLVWDLGDPADSPAAFTHAFPVHSILFSPDGRYLASGSADDRVQVWDVITRTAFGPPLPGRLGRFNADGSRLLLSSSNGGVCLWDLSRVENPSLAVPPQPTVQPFARTSDGASTAEITGREIVLKTPTEKFSLSTAAQSPLRRVAFSPDHRHLIAESPDRRAWIWDLRTRALTGPPWPIHYDASLESHRLPECTAEVRTQSDLLDLVALLAGQRPDGLGGMLPVEAADRERLLNGLQRAYPAEFGLTDTHRTRWHREHAAAAEETMDWEAAVFHWEHLLKSEIRNPKSEMPTASRLAYARAAAERIRQALRQGNSRWSVILPRPPQATSAMLDLEPFYTQPLGVTTAANPILAPFRPLAAKVHHLDGTGFDVRGIVQLNPGKTLSIPVNRPCHRVHFLHAASQSAAGLRETAASYRVHFADGDTASVRLSNPEDLPPYRPGDFLGLAQRDWQGTSPELHCTLVWSDSAIGQVQVEEPVILTRTTWEISDHPPGRWLTSLELQAGTAESVPLIFAITVE